MTLTRTSALLGAAALLVASTAVNAQSRAQGSGIRISKDVPAVSSTPESATVDVVSGGDVSIETPFDITAYANLNEKNMTAIMAGGDSLEIQLAQLAQSKGTAQAVRDYATMLNTDHTAHLAKTIEIITDEDVGAEPPARNPEGMRMQQMLAKLREMPAGTNWDRAFIRFQVEHHQNVIDILSPNIKNAHDDDLEDHIEKTLTSLAKHRDMGRAVGTNLGLSR
jgi:putative membrane protein